MPGRALERFTEAESGIAHRDDDDASAETLRPPIALHRNPAALTRVLEEKAYVYRPAVSRSQAIGNALGDLVDRMFGGSAESLVMSLVETKHLTPEKLARLQKLVEQVKEDKADETE